LRLQKSLILIIIIDEAIKMNRSFKVNAIYKGGMFKLLESINLTEGTLVRLNIEPQEDKKRGAQPVSLNRYIPVKKLSSLKGIVSIGGDSLNDSESLYDSAWN
jgi:predicted DNA-binding antitoxin AbrB/MazE fold protein